MALFSVALMKIFALFMERSDEKRDKGLETPSDVYRFRDLRYAPGYGKERLLDVYTLAEEGERFPVLVSVHGGGFCYGDKERYRFYCMELAKQGYTVVNFNYRLLPSRYPAPLEDLNAVMRFIAARAPEYRMDPKRVYGVGDSVGATLLSLYAAILSNEEYAARFDFTPPDIRFRAVALHSGVYDCGKGVRGAGKHAVRIWLQKREERNALRTEKYIDGNYPPVFLSYSVNDAISVDTPDFFRILQRKGVVCELRAYGREDKKIDHVFHLDIRSQTAKDCFRRQHAFFAAQRSGEN